MSLDTVLYFPYPFSLPTNNLHFSPPFKHTDTNTHSHRYTTGLALAKWWASYCFIVCSCVVSIRKHFTPFYIVWCVLLFNVPLHTLPHILFPTTMSGMESRCHYFPFIRDKCLALESVRTSRSPVSYHCIQRIANMTISTTSQLSRCRNCIYLTCFYHTYHC